MSNILVIEDNPVNLRLLQNLLLHAGYQVNCAEHGIQALELLAKQTFDLVLMDLSMPIMDGFETIAHIRAETKYKSLPIIAVAIDLSDAIRRQVQAAGFSDFLSKPYSRDALLELVCFHLDGTKD